MPKRNLRSWRELSEPDTRQSAAGSLHFNRSGVPVLSGKPEVRPGALRNSCFLVADVKCLPWIGGMSLRYMELELRREPGDIIDWVGYARFSLRHRLPTLG